MTLTFWFFLWVGIACVATMLFCVFSIMKHTDDAEEIYFGPPSQGYRGQHPHNDEQVRQTLERATRTRSH